ncbi:MAG: GTPase Era [Clostridia bacterium]|nr:GTPase Era [Clostridia bacterium]
MTKSAFIAIVGRPNVGKSSLLNAIVGQKVAIVSDKPQTTRTRIMGVCTRGEVQLVFLDTPGVLKPHTRLGDFMKQSIEEAMSGVDAALMVVEPTAECRPEEATLIEQLKKEGLPTVLAINKIDTVEDKAELLACMAAWNAAGEYEALYPVSARDGDGVDGLFDRLAEYAFESPHFFPADATSDQTESVLAAELVREQMLRLLRQEVPHGVAVLVEPIKERDGANGVILDVEATILCDRDNHKGIIIGKKGAMLKKISTNARQQMERLFGAHVNLQCWVKVKEDWRNRQSILNQLGYRL